jgi:hypothetical protein
MPANNQSYSETRALLYRARCYKFIEKNFAKKKPLKTGDMYDYAGEVHNVRRKDVSRLLYKFPNIKRMDKQTSIIELRKRNSTMLYVAHIEQFVNYYKSNRSNNPNPELDKLLSCDERNS